MKQGLVNLQEADEETVYRLDVDSEGKLKLNLPNRDIILFDFYDEEGELSCEWLLENYNRNELAEMIEYSKTSEFDSHFYTNNTFEDIIVRRNGEFDKYTEEITPSDINFEESIDVETGSDEEEPLLPASTIFIFVITIFSFSFMILSVLLFPLFLFFIKNPFMFLLFITMITTVYIEYID